MFKKANVVMLATNQKAELGGLVKSNRDRRNGTLGTYDEDKIHAENRGLIKWEPQYLYILSNEEFGENDWILHKHMGTVIFNYNLEKKDGDLHKIIASTDPKLSFPNSLPQPSPQFIQKYIEEYNKGNVITDIMIEYEEATNQVPDGKTIDWLKVNSKDNTITIKKIKDSWSREEVKFIATRFRHHCDLNSITTNNDTCNEFDKWFEE